jgi:hypothetical protein
LEQGLVQVVAVSHVLMAVLMQLFLHDLCITQMAVVSAVP